MSIDLSQFNDAFFEEALDGLDQAEEALLSLEKQGMDGQSIDAAFRAIHSIKGSSGTLGFAQITEFAHGLEAVLENYRNLSEAKRLRVQDGHMSLILSALDLLRAMVGNAQQKQGDISPSRVKALGLKLKQVQTELENQESDSEAKPGHTQDIPYNLQRFHIQFRPHPEMLQCGNDPLRYLDALAAQGKMEVTAHLDELAAVVWQSGRQNSAMQSCLLHWSIALETHLDATELRAMFEWIEDLCDLQIEEDTTVRNLLSDPIADDHFEDLADNLDSALNPPNLSTNSKDLLEPTERRREQRAIQVPTAKIDGLLAHLADLAMFQSELEGKVVDKGIHELFNRLGRQTRQLQDAILGMRMSPIATLFKRFERVIRDAEIELGKRVQIVIKGENNELDSSIIERLIDPVTHLIRNALDHGIESPSERTALGKPGIATLSLIAEQRGSSFVLSISEDGRGFDIPAIRARAIQKGLATAQSERSDAEWAEMLFGAGFSTAAQVNQWSGRGVGLDAVVEAIKSLNGQLIVSSTPGQGTSFTIELPLTLALTDALIVESNGEQYALAINTIGECLKLASTSLQSLSNGQQLYSVREQLLPYLSLATLMRSRPPGSSQEEPSDHSASDSLGIVLRSGHEACLLGVTRIIGERQIVIKSIEKNLGTTKFCQSATILGEGKVTFVLDSAALCKAIGLLQLATA
jgi:two-component system, chemotaxis family, sensor kinase CheA